jgi:hypothetical protein
MAPATKKDEKVKDGRLRMEETIVTKVIREVKKKEDKDLKATEVARVVSLLAAKDEGWVKNASHWADSRTLQSIRAKVRLDAAHSKVLGVISPPKATAAEATGKGGQGKGESSEWSKVEKKKKGQNNVTTAWKDMTVLADDFTIPAIKYDDVGYDAEGIAMTTLTQLIELVKAVRSSKVLVIAIPGTFDPSTLRDDDTRSLLTDISRAVCQIVAVDVVGQPCTRTATLFSIGADKPYRRPTAAAEVTFSSDAMRELTVAAVLGHMKETDRKMVKRDPKSLILKMLENMGIDGKERAGVDLHAFRDRGEEVEAVCAAKKEVAEKILRQQRPANGAGIFIRECVRAGSDVAKAPVVWFPQGTTIGEAMAKAELVAKGTPLAWAKSMGIGVRVAAGDLLRKARSIILKEENRPTEKAMEVRGTDAWIISNLPLGFDKSEVLCVLAEWGWPVLEGRSMRSKTEMRVLADVAPKKLTISSGGKVSYVLRREFPADASPHREQQTEKAGTRQNAEGNSQEQTQQMEQDDYQTMIDEQMQGFLNSAPVQDGAAKTPASASSSASSSSTQAPAQSTVRVPAPSSAQHGMQDYKKDMLELRQEILQMMKKMEERQDHAEQRQDVAEKRIEGAIDEIVAEQKSAAASTTQVVGDLKAMMALMVQQQNTLSQQQTSIMQMLQGDDRRVKPKVESTPLQ